MPLFLILIWVSVALLVIAASLQVIHLATGRKHQQLLTWSKGFGIAGAISIALRMLVMFSS
jgi:hypothetical protein